MKNEASVLSPAPSVAAEDADHAGESALIEHSALTSALLHELALSSDPVPILRLTKRLRVRLSSLLRCVAYLGEGVIAGNPGLGWVQSHQDGDRILLSLTPKGREQWR